MSEERQETVADIVAAMRNESHAGDECFLEWVGEKMRSYADRIEAAAKREREATRDKSSAVGNAEKMREALRLWVEELCEDCQAEVGKTCDGKCEAVRRAVAYIEKAGGKECSRKPKSK